MKFAPRMDEGLNNRLAAILRVTIINNLMQISFLYVSAHLSSYHSSKMMKNVQFDQQYYAN